VTSATRPDKFPAWVAALPLNNIEASLEEMDRAIALGIQIFTDLNGKPLDEPEFLPIFERAVAHPLIAIQGLVPPRLCAARRRQWRRSSSRPGQVLDPPRASRDS
jgi:hypothetical protein